MDMPIPSLYKKLAVRLQTKKPLLWKLLVAGTAVCSLSVMVVLLDEGPHVKIPLPSWLSGDAALVTVMLGIVVGAHVALLSLALILTEFWFRKRESLSALKRQSGFWPRFGGGIVLFSEWFACWALFCLWIPCLGLAFQIFLILFFSFDAAF